MARPTSEIRNPSWSRVSLLIALGVTAGLAWTDAGRGLTRDTARELVFGPKYSEIHLRILPTFARDGDSRYRQTYRAFVDVQIDDENPDAPRPLPSPDLVAGRLAGIDGWNTAVLFDETSRPSDLHRAGLDATASVLLAGSQVRPSIERMRDEWRKHPGPVRSWRLVLLDDIGCQVASVSVNAWRPGFARGADPRTGETIWIEPPGVPSDGDLPAVTLFRRTASGQVVVG